MSKQEARRARIDQRITALEARTDLHPQPSWNDPCLKDKCLCGHTRGAHWLRHHSLEGFIECARCTCEGYVDRLQPQPSTTETR